METSLQELRSWTQGHSFWIYNGGLSCCTMEVLSVSGPRYDWERFGCISVSDPGNADVLIVAGPVTESMREEVRSAYEKMRSPKFVISVGSCANTGGMFVDLSYTVTHGLESILPVDLYVPGCPPRPEALLHALIGLQKKIARQAAQ